MASEAKSVMLAEKWDDNTDPTGFWMCEKLDGVRAYWNGSGFYSRQGNQFSAPAWFIKDLPKVHLDGELWCGRGLFQKCVSAVKKKVVCIHHLSEVIMKPVDDEWKNLTYLVFDAPKVKGGFEERLDFLKKNVKNCSYASLVGVKKCQGRDHLRKALNELIAEGGEGLMLRKAGSPYENRRSKNLLKVKTFHDEEALVIDYEYKEGSDSIIRHLECRLPNGQRFSIGTGFSDKERKNPPPKGSVITFKYFELQESGKPRFPAFLRIREDVTWEEVCENAKNDPPFSQKKKIMAELGKKHSVLWTKVPSQTIANAGQPAEDDDQDTSSTNNNNNNNSNKKADKKKEAKPSKPVCMYGEKCYRKTEDHLNQFDHPWRDKPQNDKQQNEKQQKEKQAKDKQHCKYGEECRNMKEEHRSKFLHVELKVDGNKVVESVFYEEEEEIVIQPVLKKPPKDDSDTDEMAESEVERMKYNSDTDEMEASDLERMRQTSFLDDSTDGSDNEQQKVQVQQQKEDDDEEMEEIVINPGVKSAVEDKPKDLPLCKFGATCNRKNPQHFKEYSHPKEAKKQPQKEEKEKAPELPQSSYTKGKSKKDLMKQQKNDEAYEQIMNKKQKIK